MPADGAFGQCAAEALLSWLSVDGRTALFLPNQDQEITVLLPINLNRARGPWPLSDQTNPGSIYGPTFVLIAPTAKRQSRRIKVSNMTSYRAYAVRPNGNFDGYKALICANDDEAIVTARCLTDASAIELWTSERFVTRMEHKSK